MFVFDEKTDRFINIFVMFFLLEISKMNGYTIYSLIDPTTGKAFYIGKTNKKLRDRLSVHLCQAKAQYQKTWKVLNRIRSLLEDGQVPIIEKVDSADTIAECRFLERFYINFNIATGNKLENTYLINK